jgi:two-component system, OmpR family, sensor histidine kinase SenX3
MVGTRRRKSNAFIVLGVAMVLVIILLYIGWGLLNWRTGFLLFLGILLLAIIIAGIVVNTIFLVREIRRNEQHDAFINAVTHELKTPIASIRLYIETLQTRHVDEETRNKFYGTILADSDRLLGTIEQILRTGRLGSSAHKPDRRPIDLTELTTECVERARLHHNLPAEAVHYKQGAPLPIVGDYDEIRAAVSNLLDNAVKYSAGDVHIQVSAAVEDGRFAVVKVRDEGTGIAQPELKRIFKRFYRAGSAVASRVKGTGLGLYIVRSVARRNGARVWAESEGPGQGSLFVMQFPLAR